MKKLCLLLFTVFCISVFAANEINYHDTTSLERYTRVVRPADGYIWDADGNEFSASPTWANTAIDLTEDGQVVGLYQVAFPTEITTAGSYLILIYDTNATLAANTDTMMGWDELSWDGLAEITLQVVFADVNDVQDDWAATVTNIDDIETDTGTTLVAQIEDVNTKVVVIDGISDNILTDTGTTLVSQIEDVNAKVVVIDGISDNILTDTGTTLVSQIEDVNAKVVVIDGISDNILTDTGTTLVSQIEDVNAKVVIIDTAVDAIKADTDLMFVLETVLTAGGTTTALKFQVGGSAVDDIYNGMIILIENAIFGDWRVRRIVDYDYDTNRTITIDRAVTMPSTGDRIKILGISYGDTNVTHIETADPTDTITTSANASIVAYNLDHLCKNPVTDVNDMTEIVDNTIFAYWLSGGDPNDWDYQTDTFMDIYNKVKLTGGGGFD